MDEEKIREKDAAKKTERNDSWSGTVLNTRGTASSESEEMSPESASASDRLRELTDIYFEEHGLLDRAIHHFRIKKNKQEAFREIKDLLGISQSPSPDADLIPEELRNDTLDRIYTEIDDTDTLVRAVQRRFGVPLSPEVADDGDKDAVDRLFTKKGTPASTWSPEAVKHIYKTYCGIPKQDLDTVHGAFSFGKPAIDVVGSCDLKDTLCYEVDYNDKSLNKTEELNSDRKYVDSETDGRVGQNIFDLTHAHEIGHAVDGAHKGGSTVPIYGAESFFGLSNRSDFREISGWKSIPNDDVQGIKNFAKSAMSAAPFSNGYAREIDPGIDTKDIEATADIMANKIITESTGAFGPCWDGAESYFLYDFSIPSMPFGKAHPEKVPSMAKILGSKDPTNILWHLASGLAGIHTYADYSENGGKRTGMKRPFHQSYHSKTCWYSFDPGFWSDKVSTYQYTDPAEEFAEVYASFHVSKSSLSEEERKNDPASWNVRIPDRFKPWFIQNGLHNMEKTS